MTEHHYPDGSYDVDWTEPPTDDEREALTEDALTEAVARLIQQFEGDPEEWRNFRDAANAILAAGFRRQGPITDAQLLAALNAYDPRFATKNLDDYAEEHQADMRAALEAARDA